MAGWDDAHFLDVAILHPFRHADADDLAVMGFREGAAHRHLEPAAPDVDGIRRQREAEQTAPLTIVRNPDLLVIAAFLLQFQEGEERLEAAVGHLQRLLCHARLQEPVVFVGLAELVVLLVSCRACSSSRMEDSLRHGRTAVGCCRPRHCTGCCYSGTFLLA